MKKWVKTNGLKTMKQVAQKQCQHFIPAQGAESSATHSGWKIFLASQAGQSFGNKELLWGKKEQKRRSSAVIDLMKLTGSQYSKANTGRM